MQFLKYFEGNFPAKRGICLYDERRA